MGPRLTAADACAVTGYSRDELQALLRVMAPYAVDRPAPRVAREFTPRDLIVLGVTQLLEQRYGLRRTAVAEMGPLLHEVLAGPRLLNRQARLAVTAHPARIEYLEDGAPVAEGLVIALGPLFDKVDTYLNFGQSQLALQFGPTLMGRKYG